MQTSKLIAIVIGLWLCGFLFFVLYSHTFLLQVLEGRSTVRNYRKQQQQQQNQLDNANKPKQFDLNKENSIPTVDENKHNQYDDNNNNNNNNENDNKNANWPWKFSRDELAWKARVFVNMAAYRDKRCHHSIWQAITRAANPDRVYFGVYQQHDDNVEPDCVEFKKLCLSTGKGAKAHLPLDPKNEYG